ncbi:uncharacterized protein [Cherax quadricarinatus]|uniref:uncharacterized protein isoform X2 n=1 Tax=Cherax quadricarinatus TaxID=27406 RepID=UPI00387E8CE3
MEWVSGPPAVISWCSRQTPDEPDPWLGSGSRKTLRTHQRNCLFPIKVVTQTKKKCFYHHSLAKVALILHLKTANVSTTPLRCCIISTSLELPNDSEGSYQLIVGLCSHKAIENDMINNIVKLKYPESNHCVCIKKTATQF